MNNEGEESIKKQLEYERQQKMNDNVAGQAGTCGYSSIGAVAPPSLRERIAKMRHSAERQSYRAGVLRELEYLLDKNPEVAKILDLMETMREF